MMDRLIKTMKEVVIFNADAHATKCIFMHSWECRLVLSNEEFDKMCQNI